MEREGVGEWRMELREVVEGAFVGAGVVEGVGGVGGRRMGGPCGVGVVVAGDV